MQIIQSQPIIQPKTSKLQYIAQCESSASFLMMDKRVAHLFPYTKHSCIDKLYNTLSRQPTTMFRVKLFNCNKIYKMIKHKALQNAHEYQTYIRASNSKKYKHRVRSNSMTTCIDIRGHHQCTCIEIPIWTIVKFPRKMQSILRIFHWKGNLPCLWQISKS